MAQTQTSSGTIVGYFAEHDQAERAVAALLDAGFTSAHLGVAHRGSSSTTSEAANTVGEKTAGVWDKIKNFFEGGAVEPYADERTQGDLANREITPNPADSSYSRSGSDRYGSSSQYGPSDLHQSLTGLEVPEDRARYIGHRFGSADSGAIVTVKAGDRGAEAESILAQYGADLGQDAAGYDYSPAGSAQANTGSPVEGTQNIQLLGEVLRVHKDRIDRGEVILRKEVITETQQIQVPVTREELVIERRAVAGETPSTGTLGDNSEIRIPLSEERASIDKSTVVNEEVSVGKKPVQEVRDLSGEVRREELVVDDQTRKAVNR